MDLGTRLKDARHGKGLTLEDLSAATRIPRHLLEALETNDFARLPSGLITRAHLRAYASRVGLNPEEVVDEYRSLGAPQTDDGLTKLRAVYAARDAPGIDWRLTAGFAAVVVLVAGIARVSGPPESDDPTTVASPLAAGTAAGTAPVSGNRPGSQPEDFGEEKAARVRLEIEARGPCWVSATADGRPVIHRLMQPNEHASVEAWRQIEVLVGDAAAFMYWVNDEPGRSLGEAAQVVTVQITPDNYQDFIEEPLE
ncbi:MAG: hypothetical protein A3G76_03115 [Acidobacteria bacterium RIFCSPLOWO2_12_FULL_65_11]|nr:MAG: hypothetical protein A3H95_10245 [Acidobacteria bacterium RIFCSPLOWO2_02_FULL_64_15]OFW34269.1 MAG: hypothetical protein A3G76_03115 [Acidobacteria bacterium RIFCSPLOWO2_12_FULL_65_11]